MRMAPESWRMMFMEACCYCSLTERCGKSCSLSHCRGKTARRQGRSYPLFRARFDDFPVTDDQPVKIPLHQALDGRCERGTVSNQEFKGPTDPGIVADATRHPEETSRPR